MAEKRPLRADERWDRCVLTLICEAPTYRPCVDVCHVRSALFADHGLRRGLVAELLLGFEQAFALGS
jgi:hypothetical protein